MDRRQERMKKEERERERVFLLDNGRLLLEERIASCDGRSSNPIRNYSAKDLIKATNNFDSDHLFFKDQHAYTVYKGSLEDRLILVKKYGNYYKSEAIRDIVIGSQMSNHKNVLKLLGCCLEFEAPALVHEYAGDGVLSDHLYGSRRDGSSVLSWKSRIRIAKEIANVVTYLHIAFRRPIIHRDLKSWLVFLDEHGVAKLSDFSISISIPDGEPLVKDNLRDGLKGDVQRSYGFLDPEYIRKCYVTEKVDVYSFGVLLLELLTGHSSFDHNQAEGHAVLMEYVIDNFDKGRFNDIVDPKIFGEGGRIVQERQLKAFVQLAFRCILDEGADRPAMIEVAKELRRIERSVAVIPC